MTTRAGNTVPEEGRTRRALLGGGAVLALLTLIKLLVHLLTAENYGYFRDELYYGSPGSGMVFDARWSYRRRPSSSLRRTAGRGTSLDRLE